MKYIDLHVHSTASDGTVSPSGLVSLAKERGLSAFALTDHDTVAGIPEAIKASADTGIEVVPGIEISTVWSETEVHVLGLYIDYESAELLDFLDAAAKKRRERNEKILKAFQDDGFSLTWEDLTGENADSTVTRAHFARALMEKGYIASVQEAFEKYLSPGMPYYRKREEISPSEALMAIRRAGGIPVLAHPCLYHFSWEKTEELIRLLKAEGLGGLECFHSDNVGDESRTLSKLAKKYALLPTGGSDYHGRVKPDIELGVGKGNLQIPAEYLDGLKVAAFMGL